MSPVVEVSALLVKDLLGEAIAVSLLGALDAAVTSRPGSITCGGTFININHLYTLAWTHSKGQGHGVATHPKRH